MPLAVAECTSSAGTSLSPIDSFQFHELHTICKLKRRLSSQFASSGAVDMVEQKKDILLCVGDEAFPTWEDIADILMILLHMRLLPGSLRVTVADPCPPLSIHSELHFSDVLERRAIVRQNHRKQLPEAI